MERAAHRLLGYTDEGLVFVDPRQRIRGCFMVQGGMQIELLQPEGEGSPLRPHLTRGIKMYHQAFETDAIEAGALCWPCRRHRRLRLAGGRLPF